MSSKKPNEQPLNEKSFKILVVHEILSKNTEKAIELLANRFGVRTPRTKIGLPSGKKKALAVYTVEENMIRFADEANFFDPFVVLHEMYHCVRSSSGRHRGTEKNADRFAISYIEEYRNLGDVVNRNSPKRVD